MGTESRTVEHRLARLATRDWGVVTRRDLLLAGVSAREIKRRVAKGLLIPEHRGVYRVGHTAPSTEATYTAAVRACGEGAVLIGRAAAHLQGLLTCRRPPPPEVMCPTQRRVEGVVTRRSRRIDRREVGRWKGIPCTTVPRTLVDLAAVLGDDELARACHEAGVRYRTTPSHVQAVLDRRPNAKGAAKLRRVMSGETKVTLSELEREFLKLLRDHGLPLPQTNRRAGTKRVDCRWPEHRLTVELDSYAFHNSRHSWEQDRRREREARRREDALHRYSYADVFEDAREMLAELSGLLRPLR